MFDRLKSLPLTILLTILVWMYAEAQFTTTQPEVPISVRITSGSPDYAVRTMDPVDKRFTNILNFTVTLQGPKNQIDQIYQESQGMRENIEGDELAALTYIPTNDQLRTAAGSGGKFNPNILLMLNSLEYFRSRGVTVTFASPSNVTVDVDLVTRIHKSAVFQSTVAVETATLDPGEVEVQVPSDTLRAMGGAEGNKMTIRAVPVNEDQLIALPPDAEKIIPVRYVAEYTGTRDERIRVIPAQGNATVKLRRAPQSSLTASDVPVWASGPPGILAHYDIEVTPKSVSLSLAGPATLMDTLRQRLPGGPQAAGVFAYLDLTPDDKPDPAGAPIRRTVRYVLPDGLSLVQSPREVSFKLIEKAPPPATQASAGH